MKKYAKRTKKLEALNKLKIKSFEKNPQKGGTPAIENKVMIKNFVRILFIPKLPKAEVVTCFVLAN